MRITEARWFARRPSGPFGTEEAVVRVGLKDEASMVRGGVASGMERVCSSGATEDIVAVIAAGPGRGWAGVTWAFGVRAMRDSISVAGTSSRLTSEARLWIVRA